MYIQKIVYIRMYMYKVFCICHNYMWYIHVRLYSKRLHTYIHIYMYTCKYVCTYIYGIYTECSIQKIVHIRVAHVITKHTCTYKETTYIRIYLHVHVLQKTVYIHAYMYRVLFRNFCKREEDEFEVESIWLSGNMKLRVCLI